MILLFPIIFKLIYCGALISENHIIEKADSLVFSLADESTQNHYFDAVETETEEQNKKTEQESNAFTGLYNLTFAFLEQKKIPALNASTVLKFGKKSFHRFILFCSWLE